MKYELKLLLLLTILVALPCILLSAFALEALLGQKLIIEKKIEESYSAIASTSRKNIIERVSSKIKILDKIANQPLPMQSNLMIALLSEPLVDNFFHRFYLLDKDYNILYPEERPKTAEAMDVFLPGENYHHFENAYFFEFQEQNLTSAIEEYQKIVADLPEQKLDALGHALAGIARCYWKAGMMDKAMESYQYLSKLFQDRKDPQSLVFIIEGKSQIAEIYKIKNDLESHYQTLLYLLEYMIYNEFQISRAKYIFHYRQITERLSFLQQEENLSIEAREKFEKSYNNILDNRKQMQMQEAELKEIRQYLISELKNQTDDKKGGYLHYQRGDKQNLICYRHFAKENFHGYLVYKINLDYCLQNIVIPCLQSQEVGKDAKLIVMDYTGTSLNEKISSPFFSLVSQPINPVFPFWQIAIYLKNVRSLEELSQSQSQLYFLALITIILVLLVGVYTIITTFVREVKSARRKSNFVSNVTHELKTPLTAIKMFVETLLLERAKSKEDQRECLQIIASESDRLSRLIDRILNFARMEQKKRKFHFEWADPKQLVLDIGKDFQTQIHDTSCSIQWNMEENLPQVFMDQEAMREAIMNLLSNAYKYNDKAQKNITIKAFHIGTEKIGIAVKDNGIGIPRHEFRKIFQKFYRIEDTLTRKIEGTGLGLSLVDSIAKAHRGKVKVQSKLRQSSEFTIILPLNNMKPTPGRYSWFSIFKRFRIRK
ncbi:MAG: sensor histidine kinase [Candidatus Brocadiae bacterium]|nr:sensor histidine kinase [Candidatus Brocadiia bacterium]